MKSELQDLHFQIRSIEDVISKTENDLKHVGWVATRRITFIGAGLMLRLASDSTETVNLTPISQKGLFKTHEAPSLGSDSSCLFTLKRKNSQSQDCRGRRLIESSGSQETLVDVVENFSKCSLNDEDRFSNTSFYTAQEEQYEMTDISESEDSDGESGKPVPDWAQNAEASWLKARSKWTPESIFKLCSLDLNDGLGKIFGRQMSHRVRRSSGIW
mmetsp:Transcript_4944/g.9269  ORF Transcript_4944/g.9269 Transcript_4944/m.9269 type:complete len:215 (-) Transcript_4944:1910-2554(-)